MSPQGRYNADFNGDEHMNTADATRISYVYVRDATRISYVYVRTMPNNIEHKLHTHHPSLNCRLSGNDSVVAQFCFPQM